MRVLVERHVHQIRDGSQYSGHVVIAGVTFGYDLVFDVPIPRLEEMAVPQNAKEIRQAFQITVRKNSEEIELTDKEYGFFFDLLVELAVDFYRSPQTRDAQQGLLGMALRGEGPMADFVEVSAGMTSNNSYNFPPELCEMLRTPKFGCVLPG